MNMQNKPVDVILIGIGGYGGLYLREAVKLMASGEVRLRAIVDPMADRSLDWHLVAGKDIPLYDTLEECLQAGHGADLCAIASPISFHAEQSCTALEAGMNVLCEKPICATVAEAQRMMSARDASGCFLEIGYQWSYSDAILQLKADLLAGKLGAPQRLKTRVAWPRPNTYYQRNNWAGAIRDRNGRIVNDSPLSNATAHYLHNMLYVSGPAPSLATTPVSMQAECYRANKIENFDAACCRIETREGPEILFFTAHCVKTAAGPAFSFACEDARVDYSVGEEIVATFRDGRTLSYGAPDGNTMHKFRYCLEQCRTPEDFPTLCGPEAAMAHTLCVEGIQAISIRTLPSDMLRIDMIKPGESLTYLPDMNAALETGYRKEQLFSELGLPWAAPAERVSLHAPVASACVRAEGTVAH
ncbi:MAG: Gfo/Idh/MocA family oxidoreductase [Verrucomicrobiota bacterium JB024]|nr:Gfo/Idh/MocA family oxidoreductase [Verrucomicrobiota bacterium JB024]